MIEIKKMVISKIPKDLDRFIILSNSTDEVNVFFDKINKELYIENESNGLTIIYNDSSFLKTDSTFSLIFQILNNKFDVNIKKGDF